MNPQTTPGRGGRTAQAAATIIRAICLLIKGFGPNRAWRCLNGRLPCEAIGQARWGTAACPFARRRDDLWRTLPGGRARRRAILASNCTAAKTGRQ
jgi:hypothetical protein